MIGPSYNTGAIGYDEFFGQVTRLYIPALMEAAQLREGQAELDAALAQVSRRRRR
jgi:hypothetical protein